MRKHYLLLLLAPPLFFAVERFCHSKTDGFALVNIQSAHEDNCNWIEDQSFSQLEIFDQPFTYLDCGAQSYVFESQDKEYVLKFFKFQHMRIPPWIEVLPLPPPLNGWKKAKMAKKKRVRNELFRSIAIAYNELRDETALVYVHLNKSSHLKKKAKIYDKIGIAYTLDLDEYDFYVQKKARLAIDLLEENLSEDLLKKLIGICIKRNRQGIKDRDPDFMTNFGFIGDKAVQIDVGRFSLMNDEREDPKEEMIRISHSLKKWLMCKKSPLANTFDTLIEEELDAQNQK